MRYLVKQTKRYKKIYDRSGCLVAKFVDDEAFEFFVDGCLQNNISVFDTTEKIFRVPNTAKIAEARRALSHITYHDTLG
jgi:hypothetical protein